MGRITMGLEESGALKLYGVYGSGILKMDLGCLKLNLDIINYCIKKVVVGVNKVKVDIKILKVILNNVKVSGKWVGVGVAMGLEGVKLLEAERELGYGVQCKGEWEGVSVNVSIVRGLVVCWKGVDRECWINALWWFCRGEAHSCWLDFMD